MNAIAKIITLVAGIAITSFAQSTELEQGTRETTENHRQAQKSQQRINDISQQTDTASEEYLANERNSDITEAYNNQLRKLITSQQQEVIELKQQIKSIDETEQAVLPLLERMVKMLARFVENDTPFLQAERQQRVDRLQALLLRANVSIAEKYRQILEAYMIEVDYGRSLEAYSGPLELDGSTQPVQANFLRLGRTALYYQTLDGLESGLWLPTRQHWRQLPDAQNLALRKAIQIARQQRVPELLNLPLPPLEQSK